ncbi:MAG: DUF2065 domain-containing protein [Gammaproteobacteria bacterium]|nr:DUF2065 domain-containing protein [Gammaproteobacteria bacterium]
MWHDLGVALALLLVLEGILPFLNPEGMRRMMLSIAQQNNRALRISGLVSMIMGVVLLYVVN